MNVTVSRDPPPPHTREVYTPNLNSTPHPPTWPRSTTPALTWSLTHFLIHHPPTQNPPWWYYPIYSVLWTDRLSLYGWGTGPGRGFSQSQWIWGPLDLFWRFIEKKLPAAQYIMTVRWRRNWLGHGYEWWWHVDLHTLVFSFFLSLPLFLSDALALPRSVSVFLCRSVGVSVDWLMLLLLLRKK